MEGMIALRPRVVALAIAFALGLSACGGGGGSGANVRPSTPPVDPGSGGGNDADFTYDSGSDATWSDSLSGTGALIKDGTGTLVLTGTDTYTGGTNINEGTLQIGNGGTSGSIVGNVKNNGALVFDRRDDIDFGGTITGAGSLEQAGTGRLTLTGGNSYTGGTTISRGTLQLGNGGTTGWIVGDIADNGALVFDRSDDVTFAGTISGAGSLEQAGTGRLTLTGNNTYTGGTTISRGILQLGNGGTTGWIVGDVTDNGTLVFDRSDDVTFGGAISGGGALSQIGDGTVTLTGANTYTGGTTIGSASTLRLDAIAGGPMGSIVGPVVDDGTLWFNNASYATFDGEISGSGRLVKSGAGSLTLTGDSTHTGGTWIQAGTLTVGNGGRSGSIAGDVTVDGALVFDRNDQVVYGGSIAGSGSIRKSGSGTLTLEGDNSAFTGVTRASGGKLIVGGNAGTAATLGGVVYVDGVLGGYGTVGSVQVARFGHLAPGSSTELGTAGTFGTLTVDGDLTLQQESRLDLNLGAPGATPGQPGSGDSLVVNGDLYLNGATLNIADVGGIGPGLYNLITYTGTLSQSYGGLILAPVPPKQQFTLQYVDGQVNLLAAANPAIALWAPGGSLGGSDTWTATSATWTNLDGTALPGPMAVQPGFAEFQGAPGTVTVDDSAGAINVIGMQFFVDGYSLAGQSAASAVNLVKNDTGYAPVIEVGDGTAASAGDAATISAVLAGSDGLITTGYGRLVLSGNNTLSGQLQINGGTTELAAGSMSSVHDIVVDDSRGMGSTLQVDSGFLIDAAVTLDWDATLNNRGSINAPAWGGTTVQSDAGATIVNEGGGTITSDGDDAVVLRGGGTLINRGSGTRISVSDVNVRRGYGVVFFNQPGIIENSGGAIIEGPEGGVAMYGGGEVVNAGAGSAIQGTDNWPSYGVRIAGGLGKVTNSDGASIRGSRAGVYMGSGRVINDGPGSIIAADRLPDGDGWGVQINGVGSEVINTNGAVIRGALGGIALARGGTIVNGAGSTIESLNPGGNDCDQYENCAVYVDGRYDNTGGSLDLTNAGSIVGNVQMDLAEANTVTLTAGGSITGDLKIGGNAASTLTLNGESGTSELYSRAVSGLTTFRGTLIKDGDGTWTIDNGGLASITGTTINAGTLKATGTLAGRMQVNSLGKLDGAPRVAGNLSNAGAVAIHDGGTTVGGNYTQASTGTLAVSLGSKLDVAGTATLNGGTLEITGADSGYVSNTHTTVLSAASGLTGTFDRLVKDTGVVFTATTINYDANSVWLDTTGLDVTLAAAGAGVSYTPVTMSSALRVQGTFDQLDQKIAAGSLSDVSGEFLYSAGLFQQAPTLLAAQASLQSLSGELHAASAAMTFEAIDASSRALSDHFDSLLDKGSAVGTWMHDLSLGGDMARAGFDGVDFQLDGWLVGSDRAIGSSGVAGFAFGQSRGQQRLNRSFDRNTSRNTEAMLYTGRIDGHSYLQGRIGFGHFQQDVSRQVLLGYHMQGVGTRYDGRYSTAYGESGLHFGAAGSHVTPFIDVQYARVDRNGFVEQGAGGFGLRSNAQILDRWQAGFGVRARQHWELSHGRAVDLSARAQWQRTLAAHGDMFEASFVGLEQWKPLLGIGLSRYSSLFGVGLDATLSQRATLNFSYDYEKGQRATAQALSASLKVAF